MSKTELYKKAKEAYYSGEPIMSDEEFDNLEQELRDSGELEEYVGAVDKDAKFEHPSRMLSLSKYQADKTTGKAPTEQVLNWCKSIVEKTNGVEDNYVFEVTCKYDGNSGNCIYKNGKLWKVLTRGDGKLGRDVTEKVKALIPEEIKEKGLVEVRGEIIMKKSVFETQYAGKFANPRNLVAGILGRDDNAMIEDLCFIAYDIKIDGEYADIAKINSLGFNKFDKPFTTNFLYRHDKFDELFERMVEVRKNSDFPLDGFVLKAYSPEVKSILGENDHDPEWGKAIKFKPEGVTTKVKGIEWSMGKTGEFTPIALLEGVDLDGSTVSRACLYNAGYVIDYKIKEGTRVRIVKSGDIIPQIVEVFND